MRILNNFGKNGRPSSRTISHRVLSRKRSIAQTQIKNSHLCLKNNLLLLRKVTLNIKAQISQPKAPNKKPSLLNHQPISTNPQHITQKVHKKSKKAAATAKNPNSSETSYFESSLAHAIVLLKLIYYDYRLL